MRLFFKLRSELKAELIKDKLSVTRNIFNKKAARIKLILNNLKVLNKKSW